MEPAPNHPISFVPEPRRLGGFAMRPRRDTNPVRVGTHRRNIQQRPLAIGQEPVGPHDREHPPAGVHAGGDRRHPSQWLIPSQTTRQCHQNLRGNGVTTEQHLRSDTLTRRHEPEALQQRPFRSRYPSGTRPTTRTHQQSIRILLENTHPQPSSGLRFHSRTGNAQPKPRLDSNRSHRHSRTMANPMRHRTVQRPQPLLERNQISRIENVYPTSRPGTHRGKTKRANLVSIPPSDRRFPRSHPKRTVCERLG